MIQRQLRRIFYLSVWLFVIHFPLAASIGERVPAFRIEDQFERIWTTDYFNGSVTVFMLNDRTGYEYNKNWTDKIVPLFKDRVKFAPVADVQSVPGFLKGYIRSRFKDEFSYSVLMDWDGILIKAFRMVEDVPNIVVVDKQGVIQFTISGTGTKTQVDLLISNLNKVLAQSK